jgi:hypothetical protein
MPSFMGVIWSRQRNHIIAAGLRCGSFESGTFEQLLRHIPTLVIFSEKAHGLFIVARDHAGHRWSAARMKHDMLADPKLEHARVRVELTQEAQARHNAMVEVDQLGLAQLVDINRHGGPSTSMRRNVFLALRPSWSANHGRTHERKLEPRSISSP